MRVPGRTPQATQSVAGTAQIRWSPMPTSACAHLSAVAGSEVLSSWGPAGGHVRVCVALPCVQQQRSGRSGCPARFTAQSQSQQPLRHVGPGPAADHASPIPRTYCIQYTVAWPCVRCLYIAGPRPTTAAAATCALQQAVENPRQAGYPRGRRPPQTLPGRLPRSPAPPPPQPAGRPWRPGRREGPNHPNGMCAPEAAR